MNKHFRQFTTEVYDDLGSDIQTQIQKQQIRDFFYIYFNLGTKLRLKN